MLLSTVVDNVLSLFSLVDSEVTGALEATFIS